jgi:hypothetical protein
MPLKLNSAGGGSVTINAASTASSTVLTVPATNANLVTTGDSAVITQAMMGTNIAGNGPAFSAYLSSAQTISASTWTKAQLNTKEFDTANCFDNTTNFRFTPNVAGYYQVVGNVSLGGSGTNQYGGAQIYKNGSGFKGGVTQYSLVGISIITSIIYMNGTTDYIELYGYGTSSGTVTFNATASSTFFQASLLRSA